MGTLNGSNPNEIKEMVKDEYIRTFAIDTAVWPIAQAINFRLVPARFQALYVNFISIGWAAFLSLVTSPAVVETPYVEPPKKLQPTLEVTEIAAKPSSI
jgi:hypothetical protein